MSVLLMNAPTIFITGAAAGIGRETALYFAQKGWFVGLFDINTAGIEALAEEIGQNRCVAHPIDVCEEASVKEALQVFSRATDGRLNVLFNNAGVIQAGAVDQISLEAQKRLLDINVWGVLHCSIQALPYLKQSPPACIVNMSSSSALYGHPSLTAYAASKMAVRSLTEGLDLALRQHGIRVCDVMPMWVQTGLARNAASQWKGLSMVDVRITPDRVARTVWKAVQGSRLHWLLGRETWFYSLLGRILPDRIKHLTARYITRS